MSLSMNCVTPFAKNSLVASVRSVSSIPSSEVVAVPSPLCGEVNKFFPCLKRVLSKPLLCSSNFDALSPIVSSRLFLSDTPSPGPASMSIFVFPDWKNRSVHTLLQIRVCLFPGFVHLGVGWPFVNSKITRHSISWSRMSSFRAPTVLLNRVSWPFNWNKHSEMGLKDTLNSLLIYSTLNNDTVPPTSIV